uniref:Female-specific orf protein n=1 Tax=Ellipsaria lineolata TaxID=52391 RepID=F4ZFF4_ELLLI|nr:female-specific orf protein [Ellipsaria lineolata]
MLLLAHWSFTSMEHTSAFGYQLLILVMKMKTWITNMLQYKTMQKLAIISTSLLLMILLPNLFLHEAPEKILCPKPSMTDNPLESSQPNNTPTTPTGYHPLKDSPASTDISDKS